MVLRNAWMILRVMPPLARRLVYAALGALMGAVLLDVLSLLQWSLAPTTMANYLYMIAIACVLGLLRIIGVRANFTALYVTFGIFSVLNIVLDLNRFVFHWFWQ